MKNFKLLLATTAILSTTSLAVIAGVDGQDTLSLPASVEIIQPIQLGYSQALDFGRIVVPNADGMLDITLGVFDRDESPLSFATEVAPTGSYILEQGKVAILTGVTSCDQVTWSIPDDGFPLTVPANAPEGASGEVYGLYCDDDANGVYIGGQLSIFGPTGDSHSRIYPGEYKGNVTITAVYPDDPRVSSNSGSGNGD